jgi:hypothetical protein
MLVSVLKYTESLIDLRLLTSKIPIYIMATSKTCLCPLETAHTQKIAATMDSVSTFNLLRECYSDCLKGHVFCELLQPDSASFLSEKVS